MKRWEVILNTENEETQLRHYYNEEIQQELHFSSIVEAMELLLKQDVCQVFFKRLNHKGILTEFKMVNFN